MTPTCSPTSAGNGSRTLTSSACWPRWAAPLSSDIDCDMWSSCSNTMLMPEDAAHCLLGWLIWWLHWRQPDWLTCLLRQPDWLKFLKAVPGRGYTCSFAGCKGAEMSWANTLDWTGVYSADNQIDWPWQRSSSQDVAQRSTCLQGLCLSSLCLKGIHPEDIDTWNNRLLHGLKWWRIPRGQMPKWTPKLPNTFPHLLKTTLAGSF